MPGLAEKADPTTKASGESIIGSARSWFELERYRADTGLRRGSSLYEL